jgi:predicted PurR-regulated permease PerM
MGIENKQREWMKKNPRTMLLLTSLLLLLLGFFFLGDIFTPLLVAFVLAYVLEPIIGWLNTRGVRRTFGVCLIYIILFASLISLLTFLTPKLIDQTRRLYDQISSIQIQSDVEDILQGRIPPESPENGETETATAESPEPAPDEEGMTDAMPRLLQTARDYIATHMEALAGRIGSLFVNLLGKAITGVTSLARFLFDLVLVLVFGFFFMLYFPKLKGMVRDSLPPESQENVLPVLLKIDNSVSNFFRGRLLLCIISGVVCSIGLRLSGINYWLLLGLASGILGFVPIIGVLITFIPACAFAILTSHPMLALFGVVLTYAIVQMIIEPLVGTLIISHEVKMHPAMVMFAILIGGRLFGLLGVILSIPAAAAIRVIVLYYRESAPTAAANPGAEP